MKVKSVELHHYKLIRQNIQVKIIRVLSIQL